MRVTDTKRDSNKSSNIILKQGEITIIIIIIANCLKYNLNSIFMYSTTKLIDLSDITLSRETAQLLERESTSCELRIMDVKIKPVLRFTYLISVVTESEKCNTETRYHIRIEEGDFQKMRKVLRDPKMSPETKCVVLLFIIYCRVHDEMVQHSHVGPFHHVNKLRVNPLFMLSSTALFNNSFSLLSESLIRLGL